VISFLEKAPLENKKWTVFLEVDVGGHRSQWSLWIWEFPQKPCWYQICSYSKSNEVTLVLLMKVWCSWLRLCKIHVYAYRL
jgi:hypothetical protein